MQEQAEADRVLRTAAWMWSGYLVALAVVDTLIYPRGLPPAIGEYYLANGAIAALFLGLSYWERLRARLGGLAFPLMIVLISGAPIVLHHVLVPRFPPGPLANAEGMALRQLPVLFLGLALTAWRYELAHVLFFGMATAALELVTLVALARLPARSMFAFVFITLVRTVSFFAVGIFISQAMTRLREGQRSLRGANTKLAHYAAALEDLTVSRERNRMARELHDTLAHTLTGLSVTLETAKAYWEVDSAKARQLLETSLEATRTGLEETRRALKALRASPLEDLGLRLGLLKMAESSAARASLALEFDLPDPLPSLPPDVEQCIFRVAQEAVENVAHHAGASRLRLELRSHPDGLTFSVQDDGRGFDPGDRASSGHFGLVGMRERAELSGGRLAIESQPGKGTTVSLVI